MTTITVQHRYVVDADQSLSFTDESAFSLVGKPDKSAPQLLNHGNVDVSLSGDRLQLTAVDVTASAAAGEVVNAANGLLSISGEGEKDSVTAVCFHSQGMLDNAGSIRATSSDDGHGEAYGVVSEGPALQVHNDGIISAEAGEQAAGLLIDGDVDIENAGQISTLNHRVYGISGAIQVSGAASFSNSGEVSAMGRGTAIGVWLQGGVVHFENTGTITAQSRGEEESSTGVLLLGGADQTAMTIDNSGTIRAKILGRYGEAIQVEHAAGRPVADVTVQNTGRIIGGVLTADGDDRIFNDGIIRGAIQSGAGDDVVIVGKHGITEHGLYGEGGDDSLVGGRHNDTLDGGDGVDTLTGGKQADTFVFAALSASPAADGDLITDLSDVEDRIDLSHIDANKMVHGDQAFTLVDHLDGHAGQAALSYEASTGLTLLQLDADGDGAADAEIRISGDHQSFGNFVL